MVAVALPPARSPPASYGVVRRKPRATYKKLFLQHPPAPAFGGVGLESRQQHGVTLGRAPRPCLLPGPQEKVFPRNLTQLPAAPGPGEYANAVEEAYGPGFEAARKQGISKFLTAAPRRASRKRYDSSAHVEEEPFSRSILSKISGDVIPRGAGPARTRSSSS